MQKSTGNPSSKDAYVLDSYAIMAYLEAEHGGERICSLLEAAEKGSCRLFMCIINLGEVVYIVERERGLPKAQEILARIEELPIEIVDADRKLTLAAAHIKKGCPVAYADCFAAALSQVRNAILITGDPEFRKIETSCDIAVEWLME
jgi:ribonuclease VapC